MKLRIEFKKGETVDYKRLRLFREAAAFLKLDAMQGDIIGMIGRKLLSIKLNGTKCYIEFEFES
jgi:hypothetical protein